MDDQPLAVGQRVIASLFGVGTITEYPHETLGAEFAVVLWDTSPPKDYNEGENPSLVRTEWLHRVPSRQPAAKATEQK